MDSTLLDALIAPDTAEDKKDKKCTVRQLCCWITSKCTPNRWNNCNRSHQSKYQADIAVDAVYPKAPAPDQGYKLCHNQNASRDDTVQVHQHADSGQPCLKKIETLPRHCVGLLTAAKGAIKVEVFEARYGKQKESAAKD